MPMPAGELGPSPDEIVDIADRAAQISKGMVDDAPVPQGVMHGPYVPTENPYEQQIRQQDAIEEAQYNPDTPVTAKIADKLHDGIYEAMEKVDDDISYGRLENLAEPARDAIIAKEEEDERIAAEYEAKLDADEAAWDAKYGPDDGADYRNGVRLDDNNEDPLKGAVEPTGGIPEPEQNAFDAHNERVHQQHGN